MDFPKGIAAVFLFWLLLVGAALFYATVKLILRELGLPEDLVWIGIAFAPLVFWWAADE